MNYTVTGNGLRGIDDSLAMLGSSNFDIRSFALDFEINMVFYGAAVSAQLRRRQQQYLARSVPLSASARAGRGRQRGRGAHLAQIARRDGNAHLVLPKAVEPGIGYPADFLSVRTTRAEAPSSSVTVARTT
jgi:phosphatidylserine/phosphatidylglycerophosphate/cardiolipin synthase-like enzyme